MDGEPKTSEQPEEAQHYVLGIESCRHNHYADTPTINFIYGALRWLEQKLRAASGKVVSINNIQ
jgi:hypothetical protein